MTKYSKLILFIAAAVIILVAILVGTKGGTNTDDWPVYRNDKYGFSIKYPPGWRVSESADLTHDVVHFAKINFNQSDPELLHHYILDIFEDNREKVLAFFVGDVNDPDYILVGSEKHNKIEMTKYYSASSNKNQRLLYLFQLDNTIYVFHGYDVLANSMLDSFAFLN